MYLLAFTAMVSRYGPAQCFKRMTVSTPEYLLTYTTVLSSSGRFLFLCANLLIFTCADY